MQQWHSSEHGAACLEAAVPGDHNAVCHVEMRLVTDDQRRASAAEDRSVEVPLRLDRAHRLPWYNDQIAEASPMCHQSLELADLFCPRRKAGIEVPVCGFRDVIAGSPVDKAFFLLGTCFLRLPLDHLARYPGSENHVRKERKHGMRVWKDEQRTNVALYSPCQYESGVQNRLPGQSRSQRYKDRTNHL